MRVAKRRISRNAFELRAPLNREDAPDGTLPKSWGDFTRFLRGADPALVDGLLERLPPSFYVVGAPRCGTTTLSRALAGHPDVSFARPKETHFLLEDRSAMSIAETRRLDRELLPPRADAPHPGDRRRFGDVLV